MSKPREFAHLIKNKFGSADNINTISSKFVFCIVLIIVIKFSTCRLLQRNYRFKLKYINELSFEYNLAVPENKHFKDCRKKIFLMYKLDKCFSEFQLSTLINSLQCFDDFCRCHLRQKSLKHRELSTSLLGWNLKKPLFSSKTSDAAYFNVIEY